MKAKEYLQRLRKLDTIVKQKICEYDELRSMAEGVTGIDYSKVNVQGSGASDAPFVNTLDKMISLQGEINQEIEKLVCEKHRIISQIHALREPKHIELLYKKYVEFKRLEVVAVEMNYTYQYVVEMHGRALQEFQTAHKNLLKTYDDKC